MTGITEAAGLFSYTSSSTNPPRPSGSCYSTPIPTTYTTRDSRSVTVLPALPVFTPIGQPLPTGKCLPQLPDQLPRLHQDHIATPSPTATPLPLPVGIPSKGSTLIIGIEDFTRVSEIRFRGSDENHYLVVPAQLAPTNAPRRIQSRKSSYDHEESAVLRGFGINEVYKPLDLYLSGEELNVTVVQESLLLKTAIPP